MEIDRIYNEDCLETMSRIHDNSVDLVVTSPPYNKGFYANKNAKQSKVWNTLNGRKIAYDSFSDDMFPEDYEESEPGWQRVGDLDYCPCCVNNPYVDDRRKAIEE